MELLKISLSILVLDAVMSFIHLCVSCYVCLPLGCVVPHLVTVQSCGPRFTEFCKDLLLLMR